VGALEETSNSTAQRPVFATGKATVDDQRRIQIPAPVKVAVPWLTNEAESFPLDCIVIPGAAGGIQILPMIGSMSGIRADVEDQLATDHPKLSEAGKEWMHLVRLFAGAWTAKVTTPKTPKITIPAEVRDHGLLSLDHRSEVVVFGSGSILEIWNPPDWNAYLSRAATQEVFGRALLGEPFSKLLQSSGR
jgi:DNA-binding transcriptional regulator/RsmH inhibitor MraZ